MNEICGNAEANMKDEEECRKAGDEEIARLDLGTFSEMKMCLDCIHTPCLCLLTKLKMKIKYLENMEGGVKIIINKQGIAETAKTNGPTCDNMCIQKI